LPEARENEIGGEGKEEWREIERASKIREGCIRKGTETFIWSYTLDLAPRVPASFPSFLSSLPPSLTLTAMSFFHIPDDSRLQEL
jgi:hypothetical protein